MIVPWPSAGIRVQPSASSWTRRTAGLVQPRASLDEVDDMGRGLVLVNESVTPRTRAPVGGGRGSRGWVVARWSGSTRPKLDASQRQLRLPSGARRTIG